MLFLFYFHRIITAGLIGAPCSCTRKPGYLTCSVTSCRLGSVINVDDSRSYQMSQVTTVSNGKECLQCKTTTTTTRTQF